MTNTKTPRALSLPIVGLWFLAAILEGIDLQSAGIAGPGIAAEFHFASAQMGWIFSAGTFGLVLGAALGGRMADSFGRKIILIASVASYGLFSIATANSWDLPSFLVFRVLTGLGLGGAIPNLIALVAESTEPRNRNTVIGAMYCGMPLGSAVAAAVGWWGIADFGWRIVFYAGGLAPLIITPLLAWRLPESPVFAARRLQAEVATPRATAISVLFDEGRWTVTLALWLASFCTYFVLYLLLNWLPSLLVNKGFSGRTASAMMIFFNLGGMFGIAVGGVLMDRWRHSRVIALVYCGIILALVALTQAEAVAFILISAFTANFFLAASQMIQYSLAPIYYPPDRRGAAVGAMVAIGRTGSIAGPLAAGQLLAAGAAASVVLGAGMPGVLASALALLITRASAARRVSA